MENHNQFIETLKRGLAKHLPGQKAQMKMIPEVRRKEMERFSGGDEARKAAVLICFYPETDGSIRLVLIRRNEYDGVHSGQISFPGGRYEERDPDMVYTALREAEEETNISIDLVEVLGEITPVFIPPSNFLVRTVVAWASQKPDFKADPSEVSEILSISLEELTDPGNIQVRDIQHREFNIIDVPCYYIQGHIIWGATAMMLSEVVEIISNEG